MSKTIIGIVLGLIVIGGAYYLITKNGSTSSPPSGTVTAPVENTSQTAGAEITIQNFSFNPSVMSVKTGTTVTWTNNDAITHTITSDSGGVLNSQDIAPGQSFSFTFTTPDSFQYHCSIHTTMKGTISVTN